MTRRCIAYGDCNTEGLREAPLALWPERVAIGLGLTLTNCGHTMSTTRELGRYAISHPPQGYDLAMVQYGLVDSWLTFRGAPYVLYYPDNPLRKLARKLVKKLKKRARQWHWHERLGAVEQVPEAEYRQRLEALVQSAPQTPFVLVDTAPNMDLPRNPRIQRYNAILAQVAASYDHVVYVATYDLLWQQRQQALMADGTHLTAIGHQLVAEQVLAALVTAQTFPGSSA